MGRSRYGDDGPYDRSALIGSRHLHITDAGEEVWSCEDTLPSLKVSIRRGPRPESTLDYIVWVRVDTPGWAAMKRAGWPVTQSANGWKRDAWGVNGCIPVRSDYFTRPLREDEL